VDLRRSGILSVDDSILIDSIEVKVREEYNDYIGAFIEENKLSGVDLLLTASCRNTIVSGLHDTFCRVALLDERLKRNECPRQIRVDDAVTANLINQLLKKHGVNDVAVEQEATGKNLAYLLFKNFVKSVYTLASSWFWPRLFRLKKKPKGSVLFVDTFLFKDSIDANSHYHDRYYAGHEEYLDNDEKSSIWFAPTLYGIRFPWEYFKLFRNVAKADRNFLTKEAWLNLSDYIYSLIYSIVIPFKVKQYPSFRGLDVSALVWHEVFSDVMALSLVRALCQYRFIRRLSLDNINICRVINWSENQVNDRALNLAMKKFYPEVLTHGYQGFLFIGYYASLQPTCYELKAGTLPDVLHVINEYCLKSHRRVCDKLKLELSPAFRFSYLYNIKDRRQNNEMIVLIPLPGEGMLNESIGIIKSFLQIFEQLGGNVRAIVKLHPSYSFEKFIQLAPEFSDKRLEYTDKQIPDLLEVTSALISTASSVCVEAVSVGIPAAIYGSRFGVTMNPIPSIVSNKLWGVFYTPEQLIEFIQRTQNYKERLSIVKDLFQPVTADGTRALFTCS